MVVTPPAPPRGTASIQSRSARDCQRPAHIAVRILARHGSCELVARRRPVPDLPALLRATPTATGSATCAASRRAWTTSSGSGSTASGSTRRSRRPTTTGATTSATTRRVHPDLGTLEDLDELIARGRPARDPRAAGPRPQPHERPPRRGSRTRSTRPRRAPPRLLRLGRPGARRRPAEQLDLELRRLGVDAARADGPVLPQPVPADPARPQLVERGAARGDRRRAAVLVRPRRGRLPDRRLPRDRQGPRAARRPAARARTTTRTSSSAGSSRSTR